MSSSKTKTPVDLAVAVIRKWKETYKWVPIFGAVTAIAMAFTVGANNLPASVRTHIYIFIFGHDSLLIHFFYALIENVMTLHYFILYPKYLKILC